MLPWATLMTSKGRQFSFEEMAEAIKPVVPVRRTLFPIETHLSWNWKNQLTGQKCVG
jgi:hypothetical protein